MSSQGVIDIINLDIPKRIADDPEYLKKMRWQLRSAEERADPHLFLANFLETFPSALVEGIAGFSLHELALREDDKLLASKIKTMMGLVGCGCLRCRVIERQ